LTHRVHQALRDTGRKARADAACPIQLETALSNILSTPHLPIGMDASPHALGEIRAVPVLVLRTRLPSASYGARLIPVQQQPSRKSAPPLRCAIGNSVVETRSARDDTRMTVIGGT